LASQETFSFQGDDLFRITSTRQIRIFRSRSPLLESESK
jgi:hypothetical protein